MLNKRPVVRLPVSVNTFLLYVHICDPVIHMFFSEVLSDNLFKDMANALCKPVPIIGFVYKCKVRLKCSLGSLARLSSLS